MREIYIHRDFIEELMARDHGPISDNPMFSLTTTFNRQDFTRLLTGPEFGVEVFW